MVGAISGWDGAGSEPGDVACGGISGGRFFQTASWDCLDLESGDTVQLAYRCVGKGGG